MNARLKERAFASAGRILKVCLVSEFSKPVVLISSCRRADNMFPLTSAE